MPPFKDLTGQKFGMLTVICRANDHIQPSGRKIVMWLCECSCNENKQVEVNASNLVNGKVISCGCVGRRKSSERLKTHGKCGSRIHTTYTNMKQRCCNPKCREYPQYGGRGVVICDEWLGEDGFMNFYNWAIANGYEDSLSIDRIDVDGNYEPSNCRWANFLTQANNKQNTLKYDIGKGPQALSDLCRDYSLSKSMVWKRLKRGWTIEEALELKPRE